VNFRRTIEVILDMKMTRPRLIRLLRYLDKADTRSRIAKEKQKLTTKRR